MTKMLLVHSSEFVRTMRTKPTGKVEADISAAMLGLLSRRPGAPPAMETSNPAPSEMNTPARKDFTLRSIHVSCAFAIPAASTRRKVSTDVCESTVVRGVGASVFCSRSSGIMADVSV